MRDLIFTITVLMFLLISTACTHQDSKEDTLGLAESLMEERPDSALSILEGIDFSSISSSRLRARYALLKSMALDKTYVDTTSFDVLQPAIDFYIKRGTPDEKLKTYYYQGRIYINARDYDSAMQSFLRGMDGVSGVKDSLTLARVLVAQATLYYKQYRLNDCVNNNLVAAYIYKNLEKKAMYMKCLLRALDGTIILNDKERSDSILKILCNNESSVYNVSYANHLLRHAIKFGSPAEIQNFIRTLEEMEENDIDIINMAKAYTMIGDHSMGMGYLSKAESRIVDIYDSLTYWSVKTEILERMGEDKKALEAYRNYSRVLEIYHGRLFTNELLFSEKKHEMEVENMKRIRRKDETIMWISAWAALLICLAGLLYYRYRYNKERRIKAEETAGKLRREKEEMESAKKEIEEEAEGLRRALKELEGERDQLKDGLEKQEEKSADMRRIIRKRLELLNGLLASEITNDSGHAKEYRTYIEKIKKDKRKFQREIRKDLEATYPDFFTDLRARSLTEKEIDYVCLYAIGLKGKEIGSYLKVAEHYNVSSEIRRKLGLDSTGENLGPFLRKMMGV